MSTFEHIDDIKQKNFFCLIDQLFRLSVSFSFSVFTCLSGDLFRS